MNLEHVCDHKFLFAHTVFSNGSQRAGSGAKDILYEDKFFCEKCLKTEYRNKRNFGNSYSKPLDGAFPK